MKEERAGQESADERLLEVRDLRTYFYTLDGVVKAVDGVDLHVQPGEVFGLVGESGCGKSVTSLSVMRLIAYPGKIETGEIWFEGQDLLAQRQQNFYLKKVLRYYYWIKINFQETSPVVGAYLIESSKGFHIL